MMNPIRKSMNTLVVAICLISITTITTPSAFSQIRFIRTYNLGDYDCGYAVKQTADGGYIIGGYSWPELLLVKTNAYGNIQWARYYSDQDGGSDGIWDMCIAGNGDYVVTGLDVDSIQSDIFISRYNQTGDTVWTQSFGGSKNDGCSGICRSSDGGFVATGLTRSYNDTIDADMYIVKVDSNGTCLWQKTYGDIGYDRGWYVNSTSDGGYIIGGTKDWHAQVMKTDQYGDTTWTRVLSGQYSDVVTTNGGYVSIASTFVKLNLSGDIVWEQTNWGKKITACEDGGFAVLSEYTDPWFFRYIVITRFSSGGDSIWSRIFSGVSDNSDVIGLDIEETSDHGFIVSGYELKEFGGSDLFLLKTDQYGLASTGEYIEDKTFGVCVFPNPFSYSATLFIEKETTEEATVEIFDLLGTKVYTRIIAYENELQLQASELGNGFYIYRVHIGDEHTSGKMIIK